MVLTLPTLNQVRLGGNDYCENCNARFRDEQLNVEIFYALQKEKSSSNNAESTTTPLDRRVPLATAPLLRRAWCQWPDSQLCPDIETRPLNGACYVCDDIVILVISY